MNNELNKEEQKFNNGTSMWKGVMLRDMTKDEIIDAFNEFADLFTSREKQHAKDLDKLFNLHNR